MLDITTLLLPVYLLLLDNLLGYRGPTTVKSALCLDPTFGAWALGGSRQGLHGLVEVSPPAQPTINSPESSMMSGEAGWTVRGAHLHHALGTSQGVGSCLFITNKSVHGVCTGVSQYSCCASSCLCFMMHQWCRACQWQTLACTCMNACPHLNKPEFQPLNQVLFVCGALGSWSLL